MKRYWHTDWFLGMVVALIFMFIASLTGTRSIDNLFYDLGIRFSTARQVHPDVVVVAIDDAAMREYGGWPWPRDILAKATYNLSRAHPKTVGYALPFDTRQGSLGLSYIEKLRDVFDANWGQAGRSIKKLLRDAEYGLDTDRALADSLRRISRVVLAAPYHATQDDDYIAPQISEDMQRFDLSNIKGERGRGNAMTRLFRDVWVPKASSMHEPIPQLTKHAGAVGLLQNPETQTTSPRAVPMVVQYGKHYFPAFSLMLAVRGQGLKTSDIGAVLQKGMQLGDQHLKTDRALRIYPYYYHGKGNKTAFPTIAIQDVLNDKVPAEQFKDKVVIMGITAKQQVRWLDTPLGEKMPPVMVTAHIVSSLLNDDLYIVPDWAGSAQKLAIVLIGLYLMFLLPRFGLGTGLALSVLLGLGIINAHFILMIAKTMWVPLMVPLLALIVGHAVLSVKHALERRWTGFQTELSDANRLLGQSFQSQGQLDQAFEKYRRCLVDTNVLEQMYNLGLDYERKRQFNKAEAVFGYITRADKSFRDAEERTQRNKEASEVLLVKGGKATAPNGTLVLSNPGVQKPMLGRYQVDKELGRGAMGTVYLGHDPKIGRTVAIKTMLLSQEFEGEKLEDIRQRFFREAETAGRLNHPNIITIYDVGEEEELSYIAMDYLRGDTLLEYCKPDNLLPVKKVLELMIKVADALNYANGQNVVHRDIKPANIMYDPENGNLKVTDFGVACLTDASKTKTGTILGSPSYMSPEQLAGNKVDGRSDLFSLGVTMYQLLTGELPFIGESLASLMYKITNEKHPDVRLFRPDLPSCVSSVINKALAKDVERRFQSGERMAASLQRCIKRIGR
jgi:serine/threonine-protein kinase